jgi:adenosylhomocysteine/aminodeoxyfutalosine nucleosidase
MKIAIMGAMVEEITPLLENFNDIKVVEFAKNKYYEVNYKGVEIVIAYSKIGKVFSALTATTLIQKFKCDIVLFSGVAGAINEKLNIGDVIVATKLAQHDLDITAFGHPFGYVPEGSVFIEADKNLINLAKNIALDNHINLLEAVIATGDQFIANNEKKEWIKQTFNADAIEMEGASVAVVCDALNIPFLIIRSISDAANMDAGFDFDTFLQSSAKESAKFLIQIIDELVKNDKILIK